MPTLPIEPLAKVRTKIVATVGPASQAPGTLRAMVEAGVDVFRLNFSHGTHDEHAAALEAIRAVEDDLDRPIGVLHDLAGPKIRLGAIQGGEVVCGFDQEFTLVAENNADGSPNRLTCTYAELLQDLKPGDTILFADGAVAMEVLSADASMARLKVTQPGLLRSHQGLNFPGVALNIPALTANDLRDLDWLAPFGADYIGQSFIRRADDITWLRRELDARGLRARIVAKIEKPQAVEDLDAILAVTDAVMVARGDLGVEMDVALVPAIQKRVIAACHRARVPVIVATQMLTSMQESSRPTRAEASDVFNAVLDGTDAVMLSGETAIGAYPVQAVATMSRIASQAEAMLVAGPSALDPLTRPGWVTPITESVVEAASLVSRRLGAALVIVATHSGRTALALSKQRHPAPTLALTDDPAIARAMTLYWGVTPLRSSLEISAAEPILNLALNWSRAHGLVHPGDRVVLVRGTVPGSPVHNAMLVHEVV
jgi:pyruvate kinase